MNATTLTAAVAAAERFLNFAAQLQAEQSNENAFCCCGTKVSGAARRASLDLTRALAEMRRPTV